MVFICRVADPQFEKPLSGGNVYISYLILTKTELHTGQENELHARRRFRDFTLLHELLRREYPLHFIPPIPRKHGVKQITGDAFSPDFIPRRLSSLQRFLDRCLEHPVLKSSLHLYQFLEVSDWQHYYENACLQINNNAESGFRTPSITGNNNGSGIFHLVSSRKAVSLPPMLLRERELCKSMENDLRQCEHLATQYLSRLQVTTQQDWTMPDKYTPSLLADVQKLLASLQQPNMILCKDWKQKSLTTIQDIIDCFDVLKPMLALREQKQTHIERLQRQHAHHDTSGANGNALTKNKEASGTFRWTGWVTRKSNTVKGEEAAIHEENIDNLLQNLANYDSLLLQEISFVHARLSRELCQMLHDICSMHIRFYKSFLKRLNRR
ncbi:autophagy associated protein [Schizosaccharomyces japonicus yFS275]|uniref:Autophagy associated protein n=1 Tax=Schizosaccharomyces japonicus (strain yFS275 / FY16936) TaxID=402676 RepID=B6JZU5_SCHJY|nr:autophagy associated protein [Schizosaccharomyces japonicus yFS275]EEB06095.1 autophagy associated protein [Schizosaccharomyces japonicus yFS275]